MPQTYKRATRKRETPSILPASSTSSESAEPAPPSSPDPPPAVRPFQSVKATKTPQAVKKSEQGQTPATKSARRSSTGTSSARKVSADKAKVKTPRSVPPKKAKEDPIDSLGDGEDEDEEMAQGVDEEIGKGGVVLRVDEWSEEDLIDMEEEKETELKAQVLCKALAAPFEMLQDSSEKQLREKFDQAQQAFEASVEPFKGRLNHEQYGLWCEAELRFRRKVKGSWEKTTESLNEHNGKISVLTDTIKVANEEKRRLITEAKTVLLQLLDKQDGELQSLRDELTKMRKKDTADFDRRMDPSRRKKDMQLAMQQVFA